MVGHHQFDLQSKIQRNHWLSMLVLKRIVGYHGHKMNRLVLYIIGHKLVLYKYIIVSIKHDLVAYCMGKFKKKLEFNKVD